jgi:hypothetical protein
VQPPVGRMSVPSGHGRDMTSLVTEEWRYLKQVLLVSMVPNNGCRWAGTTRLASVHLSPTRKLHFGSNPVGGARSTKY